MNERPTFASIPALRMKLVLLLCWPILLVATRADTVTFPVGTPVSSSSGTYTVIRGYMSWKPDTQP